MAGRNLMDDSSSVCDNSYCDRRDSYSRQTPDRHRGEEADPPGNKATLGGIGGSLAAVPFLLFKSFKKTKDNSQGKENNHPRKHPPAYPPYGNSPDTEQSLDDGLDTIINSIDSATEKKERRNLVIDPPGAFHLGSHHYTADGVRYFSPLCELCIAARADADGVVALRTIDEEDVDDEDDGYDPQIAASSRMGGGESTMGGIDNTDDLSFDLEAAKEFTDFNTTDLGRVHSSMHVRHCKSKTCVICQSQREKEVYFVKSRKWEDDGACYPAPTSPHEREAML